MKDAAPWSDGVINISSSVNPSAETKSSVLCVYLCLQNHFPRRSVNSLRLHSKDQPPGAIYFTHLTKHAVMNTAVFPQVEQCTSKLYIL
jgi:hypothetical protein